MREEVLYILKKKNQKKKKKMIFNTATEKKSTNRPDKRAGSDLRFVAYAGHEINLTI